MTNKEAENIAYRIYMFFEDMETVCEVDMAKTMANSAIDIFHKLLEENPKIKEKFDWWKGKT